jgi:hypothetical protein
VAVQTTDKVIAVAVATTFALVLLGGLVMGAHCTLALHYGTGFERTVCAGSNFELGALFVLAVPATILVAGWISRRTGWRFVFYGAWTAGVLFGLAVGITAYAWD